jgi:hypothetical protein
MCGSLDQLQRCFRSIILDFDNATAELQSEKSPFATAGATALNEFFPETVQCGLMFWGMKRQSTTDSQTLASNASLFHILVLTLPDEAMCLLCTTSAGKETDQSFLSPDTAFFPFLKIRYLSLINNYPCLPRLIYSSFTATS